MVDLILLTWDHLDKTKACVESITANTHIEYRLIVVDNGSTDGTRRFLLGIDAMPVLNPTNLGFAGAVNQGLRLVRAPYAGILNNDIVVPDGWLGKLVGVLEDTPRMGLISPLTDAPKQRIYCQRVNGPLIIDEPQMVPFTCVILRMEAAGRVGLLDERFWPIYGEDDDYCFRLKRAGYSLGVHTGVTIHHDHGATTGPAGQQKYRTDVYRKLREKWGDEGIW